MIQEIRKQGWFVCGVHELPEADRYEMKWFGLIGAMRPAQKEQSDAK